MICFVIRNIAYAYGKHSMVKSLFKESLRSASAKRDALVLLCCPDDETRQRVRDQWAKNKDTRHKTEVLLKRFDKDSLKVPLQVQTTAAAFVNAFVPGIASSDL